MHYGRGAVSWGAIGGRLRWTIRQRPRAGKERGVRRFQRDLETRSKKQVEDQRGAIPGVTLTFKSTLWAAHSSRGQ